MANPLSYPSLVEFVGKIRRDLDELMRRRTQVGATVLDELEDVEVKYGHADAPQTGFVLTWDGGVSSRFGGIAKFVPPIPSDLGVTEALASYADDGIFDEGGAWNFQPALGVPANTYQLVLVDVVVSVSDVGGYSVLDADGVTTVNITLPTPWYVTVQDSTGDPGGDAIAHGNGTGSNGTTVALWVHNATDADASHTLYILVGGSWIPTGGSATYDATVTATARTVFSLTTI